MFRFAIVLISSFVAMATLVVLNRKRGSLKAQVTRLETLVKDKSVTWTKLKLDTKLKALEKISCSVEELRSEYYVTAPEDQDMTEIETALMELDERVEELEVSFNQLLSIDAKNISKSSENCSKNSCKIKLPEIPLPQFSGKYEEWSMFKIEFNNIVTNNKELSEVQKLHYLHAALKHEAKLLETPEDTFDSLFKALEKRFENKRILVNRHIKSILEFERITHESSKDIRHLLDAINKNVRALYNLKFERNDFSDILLTTVILDKLDKDTRKQFELSINATEVPKFDNLITFLEKRSQTLESITKNVPLKSKQFESKSKALLINSNNSKLCVVCQLPHPLYRCTKFIGMNFSERFVIIKRNKLCSLCFSNKHFSSKCRSEFHCKKCNSPNHNTLLHREESASSNEQLPNKSETPDVEAPFAQTNAKNLSNCFPSSSKNVILSTATVYIQTGEGNFIEGRALLDSCSQINCVTAEFAKQLGLRKTKTFAPIMGLNGTTTTLNHKIKSVIANRDRDFTIELEFFIVPKITELTPSVPIHLETDDIPKNISLADINMFYRPGEINLLLGAECFFDLLKSGKIRSASQGLWFQETHFGYVASGVVNNSASNSQYW